MSRRQRAPRANRLARCRSRCGARCRSRSGLRRVSNSFMTSVCYRLPAGFIRASGSRGSARRRPPRPHARLRAATHTRYAQSTALS